MRNLGKIHLYKIHKMHVQIVFGRYKKWFLDLLKMYEKNIDFLCEFIYLREMTQFHYSDQIFSRSIITPLCSKSETFAHVELAITFLYMLLANVLIWYQLETYIKYARTSPPFKRTRGGVKNQEVAGFQATTVLKKRHCCCCFPVNFENKKMYFVEHLQAAGSEGTTLRCLQNKH